MKYLGIDVAKAKLDCLLFDPLTDKRKSKTVSNDPAGFAALLAWLTKQGLAVDEVHGVMEATGVYHELAALSLSEAGMSVSVVNPVQVKDFAKGLAVRTKTDGSDSLALARYGALVLAKGREEPAPLVAGNGDAATMPLFAEHQRVRLCCDVDSEGYHLRRDSVGTVLSIYANGAAYAVEFADVGGEIAVVTIAAAMLAAYA